MIKYFCLQYKWCTFQGKLQTVLPNNSKPWAVSSDCVTSCIIFSATHSWNYDISNKCGRALAPPSNNLHSHIVKGVIFCRNLKSYIGLKFCRKYKLTDPRQFFSTYFGDRLLLKKYAVKIDVLLQISKVSWTVIWNVLHFHWVCWWKSWNCNQRNRNRKDLNIESYVSFAEIKSFFQSSIDGLCVAEPWTH